MFVTTFAGHWQAHVTEDWSVAELRTSKRAVEGSHQRVVVLRYAGSITHRKCQNPRSLKSPKVSRNEKESLDGVGFCFDFIPNIYLAFAGIMGLWRVTFSLSIWHRLILVYIVAFVPLGCKVSSFINPISFLTKTIHFIIDNVNRLKTEVIIIRMWLFEVNYNISRISFVIVIFDIKPMIVYSFWNSSRKHTYILLTPLNPTFI